MRTSRALGAAVAFGAAVAGFTILSSSPPVAAATGLPTGFTDVTVAPFATPTSLTPLTDGRILATSQTGAVATINAAANGLTPMAVTGLTVCANAERGLLGAARDPTNGANVFLYYTALLGNGRCVNRVVRATVSGNSLTVQSPPLLDNIPSQAGNHNGGDLHVGKDNLLYVAVGDSGCDPRGDSGCAGSNNAAQDRSLLAGKILRITLTGAPAPGNPYVSAANSVSCKTGSASPGQLCREIFAYGLRNPFRIAPDPSAPGARFFINDVGQSGWEEISELVAGANYGWPCKEGPAVRSAPGCPVGVALKDPFFAYQRGAGCTVITGGAFVPTGAWPGYDGTYLFADLGCGKIFTLTPACGGGWTSSVVADNVGSVVDLQFVGRHLWYTTYPGEVRRIVPPPSPAAGPTSRLVTIDAVRKLDTRSGIGGAAGFVPGGGTRTVSLAPQVPAGAVAAVVNVTITQSAGVGFVTAWPADKPRPLTSTLNTTGPGQTVPNTALVALSPGRQLNVFTQTGGHLVVDVYGYFAASGPAAAGRYVSLTPSRLFDTRIGLRVPAARVAGQLDVQVTGRNGVPASGVSAVALVLTGTQPTRSSFVTAWAAGDPLPPTSILNLAGPSDIRANLVIVPVGAGGRVSFYANAPTHLLADVAGWFTTGSAGSSASGLFVPTTPQRMLDTREPGRPFGRLAGNRACTIGARWAVPNGASALAANLTAVGSASSSYLTAFPGGTPWPGSSNLNTTKAGDVVAAQAITRFGGGASLSFLSNQATDLVVDVTGWFTP